MQPLVAWGQLCHLGSQEGILSPRIWDTWMLADACLQETGFGMNISVSASPFGAKKCQTEDTQRLAA